MTNKWDMSAEIANQINNSGSDGYEFQLVDGQTRLMPTMEVAEIFGDASIMSPPTTQVGELNQALDLDAEEKNQELTTLMGKAETIEPPRDYRNQLVGFMNSFLSDKAGLDDETAFTISEILLNANQKGFGLLDFTGVVAPLTVNQGVINWKGGKKNEDALTKWFGGLETVLGFLEGLPGLGIGMKIAGKEITPRVKEGISFLADKVRKAQAGEEEGVKLFSGFDPTEIVNKGIVKLDETINPIKEKISNLASLDDIKKKYPNVDLSINENNKGLTLSKIVVPEGTRSEGVGSNVMKDIIKYADKNNLPIGVTPDTTFGGSKTRLESFYKKFGFVRNKGRNKDFNFRETFVRQPKAGGSQPSGLTFAPEGTRANTVPHQILVENTAKTEVVTPITQAFIKTNKEGNIKNIDQALENNPDALQSEDAWIKFQSETMGGKYVPVPPLQAIKYAQNPKLMAEKLQNLTPEMKAGVDEGFGYVKGIRSLYENGTADLGTTADLFIWGILSRGAGPVQQEGAFIDIIDGSRELIEKAINGTFTKADQKLWEDTIKKLLPSGSPGKQVTMNVNSAGQLLFELGKIPEGRSETVLQTIHSMIGDPNISAKDIRREFMKLTDGAGIDNKVVSFILLVAGRDDVLVMDRIQGRHLWDDGTFKGFNLYDGYKNKEGVQSVFRGPRGLLLTEALENGLRANVEEVYKILGRPDDASLGRWHWENWVIEGEQVVSHSTLKSIVDKSATGTSVTEGKPGTFSSGSKYIKLEDGKTYIEYPLSDGSTSLMTPSRQKEFLAFIKNPKNGIVPNNFKVTENKDIPWYERPEVNRQKLDEAAKKFSDAEPPVSTEGTVTGSGKSQVTNVGGNQPSEVGG